MHVRCIESVSKIVVHKVIFEDLIGSRSFESKFDILQELQLWGSVKQHAGGLYGGWGVSFGDECIDDGEYALVSVWGDLAITSVGVVEGMVVVEEIAHHKAYGAFCWGVGKEPFFGVHECELVVLVMFAEIAIRVCAKYLSTYLVVGEHEWAEDFWDGFGAEARE